MPVYRIKADIGELFDDAERLILDADALVAAGAITVQSIIGAAINNILFIREPGNERAEIVATHASTIPSGNTVTLASNLVEPHPAGTVVYIIRADTVRFYHSATEVDANSNDSSLTGLAAAQAIDPSLHENIYDDTSQNSGFYYWRFIDSVNSVNLLYSDAIPWGQFQVVFGRDEVGYLMESVRTELRRNWNEFFSKQMAIEEVNKCLDYMSDKLQHWSRYLISDFVIGQTQRGVYDYAMPTNIYDDTSNKSVLSVKVGGIAYDMTWKDEKEFDRILDTVKHTEVRTQPSVGATTLEIDNSHDFSATGSVSVFTSNALNTITYAGITRSATAGILSTIAASGDGSIDATHAVDTDVWQDFEEGEPIFFTIRNGRLFIYPLASSEFINRNIFMDFYEQATVVDSESDTIDAARHQAVYHWLRWKADSYWNNDGKIDTKHEDFKMFGDILNQAMRMNRSNQKFKWAPKLNTIAYKGKRKRFDYE